jgi:hypothetical protein
VVPRGVGGKRLVVETDAEMGAVIQQGAMGRMGLLRGHRFVNEAKAGPFPKFRASPTIARGSMIQVPVGGS